MEPSESVGRSPSVAVVVCVEPGGLEAKTLCMLASFRRNAGRFAEVPIVAYSPRAGRAVSGWFRAAMEHYGVVHIEEPLNVALPDYPLANKPVAMADAEGRRGEDFLVFLDGDVLCWREPERFALPTGIDLAMVADGTKTVASAGPGDPYEELWQTLYGVAGASVERFCVTALTGRRVRGWYSSGVVVCRRAAGLMAAWRDTLLRGETAIAWPREAVYLREQCTLCAVAATTPRFAELPIGYNYPVQNWLHYSGQGTSAEEAVLWHYQCFLNKAFRQFGEELARIPAAAGKIAAGEAFVTRLRDGYRGMLGMDEPWWQGVRRRLRLGVRLRRILGMTRQSDLVSERTSGLD